MRLKILAAALLTTAAVTAAAVAFPVHVEKPKLKPGIRAALTTSAALDASLVFSRVQAGGAAEIVISYKNAGGRIVASRSIVVPADRSQPVMDNQGNQISASVPGSLVTAIDSFNAQLNTLLSNAAAAGKLDL